MTFSELGLNPKILRALEEKNYKTPSPIQLEAIPSIRTGKDVIACAQTGTGKTAAFSLPLIEKIAAKGGKWRETSVLVLTPTRELASQIVENVNHYSKYLPIRCTAVFGGVSMRSQETILRKGVQIVVATPGRLLDHLRKDSIDLRQVETLILDEADNMLDMGFIKDVRKIFAFLPQRKQRQILLFSATFSPEIRALTKEFLKEPIIIQIAQENKPVEVIEQVVHPVDRSRRRELLSFIIGSKNWKQVLVFTRTKHGANRLAQQLTLDGLESLAIHGNKSQAARTKALDQFKKGNVRVLVATDVAARGLDISELPFVVNYDMPQVPENYVHRIGRTGRAGRDGKAISLVSIDDEKLLSAVERFTKIKIPKQTVPGYEPDPKIRPKPIAKSNSRCPRMTKPFKSLSSTGRPGRKRSFQRGKRA